MQVSSGRVRRAQLALSACSVPVSPARDSHRGTACSGVAAAPLPTLECFVSLWVWVGRERSCGHPELGRERVRDPPRAEDPGRGRSGRGCQGHSQERAGDAADGDRTPSSGRSRSAALGHSLPSLSLSPSAAPALTRPQTANLCPAAAGDSGDKISPCLRPGTGCRARDGLRDRAGGGGGEGAAFRGLWAALPSPAAVAGAEVSEGLTLTAKGHSAPGSAGDHGARLLQPTEPPALADPQDKPLSPFQVMPKPRRRPWPGAVWGHLSCCSSPCSCSCTRAVSAVPPVPSHGHSIPCAHRGCPGPWGSRNGGSTAGTGRMGPGMCLWLAQRSALPLQGWGARLRGETRPCVLPEER